MKVDSGWGSLLSLWHLYASLGLNFMTLSLPCWLIRFLSLALSLSHRLSNENTAKKDAFAVWIYIAAGS